MPITEKKKQYLKEYRKKNKKYIKKTSQARYLKNREERLQGVRDWNKRNPNYNKNRMRIRYAEELEINLIRKKTRRKFEHLKVACIKCGIKAKHLEFHHKEPYAYDNFDILCRNCHKKSHGTLLKEMELEAEDE